MNHLVIFAKAPRLGRVKSRLAKGIGVVPAWQFYRQNLKRIVNRMSANARWTTWLGARMGRVMTTLPSGPVVIVGTDIPDIQQTDIRQAFRRLGSYDAVLGPATDGGYWLVGLKRTPSIPRIFEDVRWSSPHALSDTLANLDRQALKVHMLRELEDVDDEQSYERWKST